MSRRFCSLILALVTVFSVALPGPAPAVMAQPAAQSAPGLNIVRGAYDILLDLFYRPIDPRDLLTAGWEAMSRSVSRQNATAPKPLGKLPEGRDPAFAAFGAAYTQYVANLGGGLTPTDVAYAISTGMADSLREGHTHFLPPRAYRSFLDQLGGSGELPVGLGIGLGSDVRGMVTRVAPNGPADRAGVKPGDVIVAVNGRDVRGASPQAFSAALAGDEGTQLTLTVDRGGPPVDLTVTRGRYYFPPLESRMLPNNVGYIRLDSFVNPGTTLPNGTELLSDFDQRLDQLDVQGARALIFDLRDNGGGDVLAMQEILGRFLPEDVITSANFDDRGHLLLELVSGQMRRAQLPMALLVNGNSASASEETASTMKEAKRAVLVGQRTAGDLASSLILPLPEGAGMQVAAAGVVSGQQRTKIDEVGVPVDVEVADNRTLADYRAGRDPQLEAAVAALATAPPPPAYKSTPTDLYPSDLKAQLAPYFPDPSQIPANDRLKNVRLSQELIYTHPNEWVNSGGGAADPIALREVVRGRGYRGSYIRAYSAGPGEQPSVGVSVDVYATPEGASQAMQTNDFPDTQQIIPNPIQLGDETVTARGAWIALGSTGISWRHGNAVFSATYSDVPGNDRPDTLLAVAQAVEALYQQSPLPAAQ